MEIIYSNSASDAWIKNIRLLLSKGEKIGSLVEILNVCTIIEQFKENEVFDRSFRKIFGDERIDYASSVTFVQPKLIFNKLVYNCNENSWKKSYWGRMIKYNGEFNQIENVLSILKKGDNVKRCELIIYNPLTDAKSMFKQPCLLSIDLKPRNKKLFLTAFFRSQRVSKSGYADYTALINLGKFLAKESKMTLKQITSIAASSHLSNENKELDKSKKLLKEIS